MATHHVIQAALQSAVDDGVFPGAQLAVRLHGELQCVVVAGRLSSEPPGLPVQPTTIYDLASLTKPLATVTSVLLLIQRAKVALEDPVQEVLAELEGTPIGRATVRDLLTHRSGLPGWRPFYERLGARGIVPGPSGGNQSVQTTCIEDDSRRTVDLCAGREKRLQRPWIHVARISGGASQRNGIGSLVRRGHRSTATGRPH